MPRTIPKPRPVAQSAPQAPNVNGITEEVLTLAEAAMYLRLSEEAVQVAVREQDLPGREVGGQWRFLKTGIQDWLRLGSKLRSNKEAWLALAGAWKADPNLDALHEEVARQRERLQTEVKG